jgi:hypothetical protein
MAIEISELTSIFSSLFTGFSVIFAVWIYIQNRNKDAFAKLRLSLIEIQESRSLYIKAMDIAAFSEVSVSIAKELRAIFQTDIRKQDVIDLFSKPENNNYTVTAIYLGLQESRARNELQNKTERLRAIPSRHQAQMPLMTEVLSICLKYVTGTAGSLSSTELFVANILRDPSKKQQALQRMESVDNINLLFREIAEIFYEVSNSARDQGISSAQAAEVIIDIIANSLLRRSDSQLKRLQNKDQKAFRNTPVPTDVITPIDRAFFYLELIKSEFSDHEFDLMFQAKVLLNQLWSAQSPPD